MNRIKNAMKLDFYAGKSLLKMVAVLVVIALIVGVAAHGPTYGMFLTMIFGVTSCGSVFSVHERNHSDKLYGILPLRKSEMIAGRYLYALIIGFAYIIAAGIMGFVIWKALGANAKVTALSYWATLGLGFVYFCFATGVSYPIYFKFSFAKANIFTMVPMYIIAVLYLVLTRRTNVASDFTNITGFFRDHIYLAPIFGLIGGLILLAVSAIIANLIYTRKEI